MGQGVVTPGFGVALKQVEPQPDWLAPLNPSLQPAPEEQAPTTNDPPEVLSCHFHPGNSQWPEELVLCASGSWHLSGLRRSSGGGLLC